MSIVCFIFLSFRNSWAEGIELGSWHIVQTILTSIRKKASHWATAPSGAEPLHRGLTITLIGTPQDEWSARYRHLYLTTPNTASEQPETYALVSAVTWIGVRSHKRYMVTWWQCRFSSRIIPCIEDTERCISIVMRWVPTPVLWQFEMGGKLSPFNITGMNVLEPFCGDRWKE